MLGARRQSHLRVDARDKSEAQCLGGGELRVEQQEIAGPRRPHDPRQRPAQAVVAGQAWLGIGLGLGWVRVHVRVRVRVWV